MADDSTTPEPGSFHILVVDDEEVVLMTLCEVIKQDGYRVSGVDSGQKALDFVQNEPVDLVLTDVMMPGMNGWELLREIKKDHSHIRVVPLTGYISDAGEALLTNLEADAYLVKPVDHQRLKTLFKALLFSHNLGRPAEVVVIDGDRTALRMIEQTLTGRGLYVSTFSEVNQALIHIRKDPPDLFILNLVMPGHSGLDLCQTFRASPATAQIPILILTENPTKEDVTKAIQLGVNGFVVKPFRPETLAEKALQTLQQSGGT